MIRTTLSEFAAFVRAPQYRTPQGLRGQWGAWAVLVALYLAGLALLGAALTLWQRAQHVPSAEAFHGYGAAVLALLVVLVAPAGEEVVFRGWLTGRPRALWLLLMTLVAAGLLALVSAHKFETVASLGAVATVLPALAGWLWLQRAAPPGWFVRQFGWWLRGSVLVFALAHLSNYPQVSPVVLPMVLPQAWAGLVFAHVRLRLGLPASILAHAVGNGVALGCALVIGG